MKNVKELKRVIVVLAIVILSASSLVGVFYIYQGHTLRSGKLTTYMDLLVAYASDHDGWYPQGGVTPLQSLQKLYPQYDKSGLGLAGLSGDERIVGRFLKEGRPIDSTVSSWVYFPGFRNDDDPSICIIWERQEGVFLTGSRANGHAVGFVGGGFNQISSADWPSFVKRQEELRRSTLLKRLPGTDARTLELQWNAEQSK